MKQSMRYPLLVLAGGAAALVLRLAQRAAGFEADTGLRISRYRLGNVTFWVKFTEDAEGYVIHSAYSHRMTVETR